MKGEILQTVVETPEFIKQAGTCMDDVSKEHFIEFIAKNPSTGDLIAGTSGARKVRWASHANKGKRGGVRIIYYYHSQSLPIFLFTAYGKNQKANISMSEKNMLGKIIKLIVQTYGGKTDE
jgi:hypothetical protein